MNPILDDIGHEDHFERWSEYILSDNWDVMVDRK